MNIVFFGSPKYVLPILEELHKKFKGKNGETPISAVVTQRPKPVGRKQLLTYSPIDTWAHKHGVPIFFNSRELIEKEISADLGVLAAYGEIIPQEVISYFKHGILNVHPSLLPKYRGSSPVQAAIIAGDTETGATIMKLDALLDHGPIVSQFKEDILPEDTTGTLRERLFEKSAKVLCELIDPYIAGVAKPKEQNHEEAIITKEMKKDDAFIPPQFIDLAISGNLPKEEWPLSFIKDYAITPDAEALNDFIRACNPWPNAWTRILLTKTSSTPKRLRLLSSHLEEGKLVLDMVQIEGKNEVGWEEFKRGYPEASL